MVALKIKWNKLSYDDFVIEPQKGVAHLKQKIYELTGVPADRQKLMAKGAWVGTLKDDAGDTKTRNIYIHTKTQFHIVTFWTSANQNFREAYREIRVEFEICSLTHTVLFFDYVYAINYTRLKQNYVERRTSSDAYGYCRYCCATDRENCFSRRHD